MVIKRLKRRISELEAEITALRSGASVGLQVRNILLPLFMHAESMVMFVRFIRLWRLSGFVNTTLQK